jgi:polyhydroxyalkanoate synthesis regulator phasin
MNWDEFKMLEENMQDATRLIHDAARVMRTINARLDERAGGRMQYDELISSLRTEERAAFAELHEQINALRDQVRILKTQH